MRITLLLLAVLIVVHGQNVRPKRQSSVQLPDGVEFLLNAPLQSTFQCQAAGYYADVDNNCQIFHICDVSTNPQGVTEVRQYSFACGNQTVFNQATMTCSTPDESIPCDISPQFYGFNNKIGLEKEPLHTDEELAYVSQYIPARARYVQARK